MNNKPDLTGPLAGILVLFAGSAVLTSAVTGLLLNWPVMIIAGTVTVWTAQALTGS